MKKSTRLKTQRIFEDYELEKSKHLEKLANKILKQDQNSQQLKRFKISQKFIDSL